VTTLPSRPGATRREREARRRIARDAQLRGELIRRQGEREHAAALREVPVRRHAEDATGKQRVLALPENLADLLGSPDEVPPLHAFGVRVLRGREAALREAHLPGEVVEGQLHRAAVRGIAGQLVGVEVDHGELGVVVEHLLKVGDGPPGVDAVAVEAAAQLVEDAAPEHPVEGGPGGGRRLQVRAGEAAAEEQLECGGVGKLGGAAEAAVPRVALLNEPRHRLGHDLG
jgi:hypothetical protein